MNKLPPSLTGYCVYCDAANSSFTVVRLETTLTESWQGNGKDTTHQAVAACNGCNMATLFFLACYDRIKSDVRNVSLSDISGRITELQKDRYEFSANRQLPRKAAPDVPAHLPANVERAFRDAERAMLDRNWTPAAGFYGKAVDRAITPVIADEEEYKKLKRPTLGQKLRVLEKLNILPPAMIEWIEEVLNDRNFAMHDEDRDFDTKGEVEPAREFAATLLTYLYTLPEQIKVRRGIE